jgi:hypothetical protein
MVWCFDQFIVVCLLLDYQLSHKVYFSLLFVQFTIELVINIDEPVDEPTLKHFLNLTLRIRLSKFSVFHQRRLQHLQPQRNTATILLKALLF